ncbi:hypothetical protein H6F66_13370 [Trichocoleus sp. FACHB-6]|nr:hypothetical protein [Trichocoleus sp. FACHB-40]MBD2063257.1 hypothetical protein [Trichocoleus sp. FACHB-6]
MTTFPNYHIAASFGISQLICLLRKLEPGQGKMLNSAENDIWSANNVDI